MDLMHDDASVASAQSALLHSLVKIWILRRQLRRYHITLSAILEESVAHDQTLQVRRLTLSCTGCICHNFRMTRL
ncbi:hypothetical protein DPMN_090163 [Dreissena polymorpha]|uniref:Uncharacterized protein n=1 Tax=Dreissena polymorpha TaxID=45954 RepID=A0A9D4QXZ2_DREPO|nr:hypothetical protein DPMN_090163 [Dreissena polymorpha]